LSSAGCAHENPSAAIGVDVSKKRAATRRRTRCTSASAASTYWSTAPRAQPADLTRTAVFLASEDSDLMTGQVLVVDGDMIMLERSTRVRIAAAHGCPRCSRAA
jgi:NAD(P)-dependent dehydrogenase (short-subunit alcohol dehydrogenase family)